MVVSAEIRLAKWRGHEPKLISIAGKVNIPGAQIQALDSRSGWATLADREGQFILPDVLWYPGAAYELVSATDDKQGKVIKLTGPKSLPEADVFHVDQLNFDQGREVDLPALPGVDSITYQDYDAANRPYYTELFDKLTAGKASDADKIDAIQGYVAAKLNYEETQWELGSPRRILEHGSQYCGHLSAAMATLLATGHYEVRTINLSDGKNPPGTHMVVEVYYAGAWHLYDPTYGLKFLNKDGNVESYRDVRLDASVVTDASLARFPAPQRRAIVALLSGVYNSGYHHFYYFKN